LTAAPSPSSKIGVRSMRVAVSWHVSEKRIFIRTSGIPMLRGRICSSGMARLILAVARAVRCGTSSQVHPIMVMIPQELRKAQHFFTPGARKFFVCWARRWSGGRPAGAKI
jgi:hypothetical protein